MPAPRARCARRDGTSRVVFRYAEKDQTHPVNGQSGYRTLYQINVRDMRPDELKYFAKLTPTPTHTRSLPIR